MTLRTRTYGALLGLLLAGLAAPAAEAGTYDVVSCGAPGAGGVNLAWASEPTGFNATTPPQPEMFDLADRCGGAEGDLLAQSHVGDPDRGNAGFLRGAQWRFDAPKDTRISALTVWRHGIRYRTAVNAAPEAETNRDSGDPWDVAGREDGNNVIGGAFGEQCAAPPPQQEGGRCEFGAATGISESARRTYPLNTAVLTYGPVCVLLRGCPRYFGVATASVRIFGARVTIDDRALPAVAASGPLFADGLRNPAEAVVADTSDNTGVRAVRLEVDGAVVRREVLPCDFRRRVPCPTADRRSFTLAGVALADGEHALAVVAEDAAGNESRGERRIRIDANGPQLRIDRLSGRTISIRATDAGSGVAGGEIAVRDPGAGAFRPLATTLSGGRLRARLDKGSATRVGLRITARDNVGNTSVVEGDPTRLTATRARIGKASRTIRGGRVRSSARAKVVISGTLRGADGKPLAGRPIAVTATLRRGGAGEQPVGTFTTGPDGRYSAALPPGPSRQVRLAFGGEGGGLPSARGVSLRVPASSSIRISRRTVSRGTRVRFSGRLTLAGQRVPRSGKLVELQAYDRGRWRTFDSTRARGTRATWRASYRFGGRPGRYPIRLRIRRESAFPFELGYSRTVSVRVRG